MRKLKIQMNMTLDGFVAGPKGQLDWMLPEVDEKHISYLHELTKDVNTILLGRKMATESIPYWENVAKKRGESAEVEYARFFVHTPKIIFSKTLIGMEGKNTAIEQGNLKEAINQLKVIPGKDIIVYGGAHFVSSLIEANLADELNLFIHPVAIGEGLPIFNSNTAFTLKKLEAYSNGIVLNQYKRT